jgi:flagellar motor component MotA
MSKRIWLIIGFYIFAVGFVFTGPSGVLFFIQPSIPLICFGLVLLGIGWSMSFVPLFPEMIESVFEDFDDRVEDLNNTVASIMNASYGSAALGLL